MSLTVEVAGKSDVGCVRKNNEDNFGYDARYGIYLVCDGMGGQAAGEVASKMAVDTVLNYFREASKTGRYPVVGQPMENVSERANGLRSAILLANEAIHEAAVKNAFADLAKDVGGKTPEEIADGFIKIAVAPALTALRQVVLDIEFSRASTVWRCSR